MSCAWGIYEDGKLVKVCMRYTDTLREQGKTVCKDKDALLLEIGDQLTLLMKGGDK